MTRHTVFLASAVSAWSIVMGAARLSRAGETNNCLPSPNNTGDPCGAEYWNIPSNGMSPDLYVYCSSAGGTCSNSGDLTQWRAQVAPSAVRLLNNFQVPGLPAQISSGDFGWCYDWVQNDQDGTTYSDFTFYPSSCNATTSHVGDTRIYIGVGKNPSLPQAAPEQLGRLRNAYTGNGNFYIGIPGVPQNNTVTANANLIVYAKSHFDQLWVFPPGGGVFYDVYKDANRSHVCLHAASYQKGAAITDESCNSTSPSTDLLNVWQMIPSYKFAGDPHPGCFILYGVNTGYTIGVAGGNGNVKNGGALIQWTYDGSANQFWCVE